MGFRLFLFLFLATLPAFLAQEFEDAIIKVDGATTVAETDANFICATLDWWPHDKCNYNHCPWGYSSVINMGKEEQHTHPFSPPAVRPHMTMTASGLQSLPQTTVGTASCGCNGTGKPRVRARRGQATDPHCIAERLRREKIAERMKKLQELVPNSNKTDKAAMLDEIIEYVKFLPLQVKVLSMSRLGAAEAVVPLITDGQAEVLYTSLSVST